VSIPLTSGESKTSSLEQEEEHFYKISGLAGQTLNSVLNELSSDANIYVRIGGKPTSTTYDCSSKKGSTTSDMCSVTLNSDADIYIRVYGYRAASYTLTVRMDNAKLLFASGFEDGVYIDPLLVVDNEDYAYIRGTDNETGFTWPIDILGSTQSALHHIGDDNLQAVNAELQTTIGYDGKNTKTLYNIEHYEHKDYTQYPYEILNITEGRKDLYVRYRMKIDSNMLGHPNTWRALFEYKTEDYKDPGEGGTGFRLISYIYTDQEGNPSWHFQGDKDSSNPIWECDSLSPTRECNNTNVPVILDEWFTTEYYWHWSEGDDGMATWKINGKIVGQHHGATTRGSNPIDFIMLTQIYGNDNPKYQWIDDIEIWDSVPDKPYYTSDLSSSSSTWVPIFLGDITAFVPYAKK